ncbi:tripartite tricarboxylate transporter substrate binding protein [Acetobacteraceae bacterium H6797]|nr:tripartite tricarboxylate transporter substrate binding protein [Acetobacteraceae bacterium H6797]
MPLWLLPALFLLAQALPFHGAAAQTANWPERPIRLVIPFGPGGLSDGIARAAGEWLSRRLGTPVVADNRPGGNGAIGLEAVARAPADGYTLIAASASHFVVLPLMQKLTVDPHKDFAPIAVTAGSALVLVTQPSLGFRTLKDFVDYVAARPGQLDYASGGTGGLSHLGMALLLHRTGLSMQHIPYRSGPQAIQDVLAGRVPAYLGNLTEAMPLAQNNGVSLLAVTGTARSVMMPDIPTVAEQGYPGFELGTWNGLAAPAGTPEPIIARIAAELRLACGDEAFRNTILRIGAEPVCGTPAEMRAAIDRQTPAMREAVRLSGATVE